MTVTQIARASLEILRAAGTVDRQLTVSEGLAWQGHLCAGRTSADGIDAAGRNAAGSAAECLGIG